MPSIVVSISTRHSMDADEAVRFCILGVCGHTHSLIHLINVSF